MAVDQYHSLCVLQRCWLPDLHKNCPIMSEVRSWPSQLNHTQLQKAEVASSHKSAKTHAGNVFVTCDLDLSRTHRGTYLSSLVI